MSFAALVDRFVGDLQLSGATVLLEQTGRKPARARVVGPERTTECLLFLWQITRGGGRSESRPPSERRIQATATDQFPLEVGRRTLVGGRSQETGAWGFWDVMRHTRFSRKSPSFQMRVETLERGFHDGLSTQTKKTDPPEVVVAVSPGLLLWYVENGGVLHASGGDAVAVGGLIEGGPEDERAFIDESDGPEQAGRRHRLVEMVRAVRDAKFRPQVLQAYMHRCALCPIALNLVDAAHIIPFSRPGSTDEVTNGLALCRLHHAAYDGGLVGVRSDYSVVMNPHAFTRLGELNLLGGRDEFAQLTLPRLRHPAEPEVRPNPRYLLAGMRERNWAADLIR